MVAEVTVDAPLDFIGSFAADVEFITDAAGQTEIQDDPGAQIKSQPACSAATASSREPTCQPASAPPAWTISTTAGSGSAKKNSTSRARLAANSRQAISTARKPGTKLTPKGYAARWRTSSRTWANSSSGAPAAPSVPKPPASHTAAARRGGKPGQLNRNRAAYQLGEASHEHVEFSLRAPNRRPLSRLAYPSAPAPQRTPGPPTAPHVQRLVTEEWAGLTAQPAGGIEFRPRSRSNRTGALAKPMCFLGCFHRKL